MPLLPSDYKKTSLDKETRAQLFQLFIEGKFNEFEAMFVAQSESLRDLRNDTSVELGETMKQLMRINERIDKFNDGMTQFEQITTNLSKPEPKSKWKFW